MAAPQKITVEVRGDLLERALKATGAAPDVELVDRALADQRLVLPPVVLTEILSGSDRPGDIAADFRHFATQGLRLLP